MTGDALMREVGRPRTAWWQVLRVALVLGWVAWAGLTWWSAPRESSVEQVRTDLAADRLTHYEWGDGWRTDGGLVSPFPAALEPGRGPDRLLLWHTSDGRQHFTTVENPGADAALGVELQASDSRQPADPAISTAVAALAITGAVLFLWALLSATDPVTGTKWFWFWLVAGVPLGLGLSGGWPGNDRGRHRSRGAVRRAGITGSSGGPGSVSPYWPASASAWHCSACKACWVRTWSLTPIEPPHIFCRTGPS